MSLAQSSSPSSSLARRRPVCESIAILLSFPFSTPLTCRYLPSLEMTVDAAGPMKVSDIWERALAELDRTDARMRPGDVDETLIAKYMELL